MERKWLKKIREDRGKTQAEVAQQSGIVQQSYQLIEKGVNFPRPETAKQIGQCLGFKWTRFYEEEEETGGMPIEQEG